MRPAMKSAGSATYVPEVRLKFPLPSKVYRLTTATVRLIHLGGRPSVALDFQIPFQGAERRSSTTYPRLGSSSHANAAIELHLAIHNIGDVAPRFEKLHDFLTLPGELCPS